MISSRAEGLLLHLEHPELTGLAASSIAPALRAALGHSITVCFWMICADIQATQVVANDGHRSWDEPGWSIYIKKNSVIASLCSDQRTVVRAGLVSDPDLWHHVSVAFDLRQSLVSLFLDGKSVGAAHRADRLVLSGPPQQQSGLVLGGYTDAAGGHFDYTFGRRPGDRLDDFRLYARHLTREERAAFVPASSAPPVARFVFSCAAAVVPATVYFDASASSTADGTALAYWWDLGDGASATGVRCEHTYRHAGRYEIRLIVLDGYHQQVSSTQTLDVDGRAHPVLFTALFVNGEDGYAAFRIPSIVRAVNGDLIAFAEGRVESVSDSTRTIRIVCKRSQDNGRTWGPLQVVGRHVIAREEYAAMYPTPVVDQELGTGRIVLLFKKLDAPEWDLVNGRGSSRTAVVFSDDHGATWHGERDITTAVQRPETWPVQIPTAGHAIQLRGRHAHLKGRLFYSGSHTSGQASVFNQHNYAFWSDDLGLTWQIGPDVVQRSDGTTAAGLNEAMAVELDDGCIMINSRNYQHDRPVGCRAVTIGEFDHAGRLQFHPTRHDATLVEPAVQASILACSYGDAASSMPQRCLLFCNPAHQTARRNLTVRLSFDNGVSWPRARVIDPGPSAYSDLVQQADGQIGVIYERGNNGGIFYGRFALEWLASGNDP